MDDRLRAWLLKQAPHRPDPYGHEQALRERLVRAIEEERPLSTLTPTPRLRSAQTPEA